MNISDLILMPKTLIVLSFLIFLGSLLYFQRKLFWNYCNENPLKTFTLSFGLVFGLIGAVFVFNKFGGFSATTSPGSLGDFLNPIVTIFAISIAFYSLRNDLDESKEEKRQREIDDNKKLINDTIVQIQKNISEICIYRFSSYMPPPRTKQVFNGIGAIEKELEDLKEYESPDISGCDFSFFEKSPVTLILLTEFISLVNVRSIFLEDSKPSFQYIATKMHVTDSIYSVFIEEYVREYKAAVQRYYSNMNAPNEQSNVIHIPLKSHYRYFERFVTEFERQNDLFVNVQMSNQNQFESGT
jgi:hypothetical protein